MSSDALDPYDSPEALEVRLVAAAADAGGAIESFGSSVEGRPLRLARVPGPRDAPRLLCCAGTHGPEFIGPAVALGLLAALRPGGPAADLRERAELVVVACLNPDAYARTWDRRGRGSVAALRPNAHGVDLNRNFPRPDGGPPSRLPFAGSDRPGAATYRGPAPLSEPETAALDRLLAADDFAASANLHSFMGALIPARVTDRGEFARYRELTRTFAGAQPRVRYRHLASRTFDTFTGEQEDHQHHVHRTWSVCVECFSVPASLRQHLRAPSTFWRFNPRDPRPWIDNDVPGLAAFYRAALALPRPEGLSRRRA